MCHPNGPKECIAGYSVVERPWQGTPEVVRSPVWIHMDVIEAERVDLRVPRRRPGNPAVPSIDRGKCVSQTYDARSQQAFAAAVCRVLRESRRRQKLTQAEVAQRTGGLVSKAALANYETGHRSLRVDVLWVIAGALGEDLGSLLGAAERGVVHRTALGETGSITVDVAEVMAATDARLAPVRRWFELRHASPGAAMTLDDGAISALAALMNVSPAECRRILMSTIDGVRPAPAGVAH